MRKGKLLETNVWSDAENKVTLTRTYTAFYDIVDGEVKLNEFLTLGDGDDYEFEGPRAEELESLVNSDDYIENETFEELGFESDCFLEEHEEGNFISIAYDILRKGPYDGSTKDIFRMALGAYEDVYGEPTEEQAHEFYRLFAISVGLFNSTCTTKETA